MPTACSWSEPAGGFFTWLTLPEELDTSELRAGHARGRRRYVPGRPFYPAAKAAAELRFSFSRLGEDELATAVERLAGVIAA